MEEDDIETWYEEQKMVLAKQYQTELEVYKKKGETNMRVLKRELLAIEERFNEKIAHLHHQYEAKLVALERNQKRQAQRKAQLRKAISPFILVVSGIKRGFAIMGENITYRKRQIRKAWIERWRRRVLRPIWQGWDHYLIHWHPVRNWLVLHLRPPLRVLWRPFGKTIHFFVVHILALVHRIMDVSVKISQKAVKAGTEYYKKAFTFAKTAAGWLAEKIKKASGTVKGAKERTKGFMAKFSHKTEEKPAA